MEGVPVFYTYSNGVLRIAKASSVGDHSSLLVLPQLGSPHICTPLEFYFGISISGNAFTHFRPHVSSEVYFHKYLEY